MKHVQNYSYLQVDSWVMFSNVKLMIYLFQVIGSVIYGILSDLTLRQDTSANRKGKI